MPIKSLLVANFRNLAAVELEPCHPGLNILYGKNGSGKTSLLEAIYYLGLGRSFRNSAGSRLIKHDETRFRVFAQLLNDSQQQIPVGIEKDSHGMTKLRMAERDLTSVTEIAYFLPLRVINSHSHLLFESGPVFRRKYLDWGLFYHSENFLLMWRQFERALKQRNAILRDKRARHELDAWTEELIRYGMILDQLRKEYVQALTPLISEVAKQLLPISLFDMTYLPGWDMDTDYASVMRGCYQEEYRFGHTLFGPHRADFEVKMDTISVKHFLSRGQQKLLICAMILAQGKLLTKQSNKQLIYLVDDLPSELDFESREKLITLLAEQQTQVFVTAIENEPIYDFIYEKFRVNSKVFHVKHGEIVERKTREVVNVS